jgi:phosphoglycolate phosphatase
VERGRFRHVFFDLDGTLIDPRDGIVGSIQYALEALGEPIPDASSLECYIGPPLADTFARLLGTDDRQKIQRAIAAYRVRFGSAGIFENRVYDGMPDLLRALSASGRALWVVTAKPGVYSDRIIDHHGLRPYFREVYGSELNGDRSDKGVLIRHVLEKERLSSRGVLMVGDRSHDIAGARANGVACVAVRWGYGSLDELKAAGPDAIVESIAELMEYVCGSTGREASRGAGAAPNIEDEPRGGMA